MKKAIVVIFIFLLMINYLSIDIFATQPQENSEAVQGSSDENPELSEQKETITDTFGKIIEVQETKEVTTGSVTDKMQEVKVEITEGKYIGEEVTTN